MLTTDYGLIGPAFGSLLYVQCRVRLVPSSRSCRTQNTGSFNKRQKKAAQKTEATNSFETLVPLYRYTLHHILEVEYVHGVRPEDLTCGISLTNFR